MAIVVLGFSNIGQAKTAALLEMKTKNKTYRGKLVAHNKQSCWLLDRDGRLNKLKLKDIKQHRKVDKHFRHYTAAELRDQLRREFGSDYEVVGTGHYLVCAKRGRAKRYAPIFEDIYRGFYFYFSRRKFPVTEPKLPLVAIVFPDRASFARYARQEDVNATRGLMGYYLLASNRVALFDTGRNSISVVPPPAESFFVHQTTTVTPLTSASWPLGRLTGRKSVEASLKDTIVHETTHQVAFNTGLHTRIGETPLWVIEGLATVFEVPGTRDGASRSSAKTRINPERFRRFGNYVKRRRKPNSLTSFVSSDKMFHRSQLDAYSQAWALTFFLMETRSNNFAAYLKSISQHDPTKPYTSAERLADFQSAFGKDVDWLDVQFVRFLEKLN